MKSTIYKGPYPGFVGTHLNLRYLRERSSKIKSSVFSWATEYAQGLSG